MPYRWYRRRLPMDICSPKMGITTTKICMSHYGQTVSEEEEDST